MHRLALTAKKAGYVPYYYLMYLISKYTQFQLGGTPIWEQDWDVLLILDACRYDVFDEQYGDDSRFTVDATMSVGSASPEWMFNTFTDAYGDQMARTAYVTGNPYSAKCVDATDFDHVEEVWRYQWDETHGTVLPEVLSDEAIRVWEDEQPERMIVHYMQPHKPYITAPDTEPMAINDFTFNLLRVFTARALGTYPDFKKAEARRGEISDDRLRELYVENLEYVVDTLDQTILKGINADIVISSDHGELLGEDGVYHHPAFTRYPELREVPWVIVESDTDEKYTPARRGQQEADGMVEEKLAELGYK